MIDLFPDDKSLQTEVIHQLSFLASFACVHLSNNSLFWFITNREVVQRGRLNMGKISSRLTCGELSFLFENFNKEPFNI